jgi:PTH1 family peptidyl-tRNA hydrolase
MLSATSASFPCSNSAMASMPAVEWLIVGLGNPGPEYTQTRHNIGWMVVERLAERFGKQLQPGAGPWYEALLQIGGTPVLVAVPTTYMNRSGEAVRALQRRYKVAPERIVIVLDELNFPLGRIHLKQGGSDGGHNGMASVIEHLGTDRVLRLRCGIGRDFPPGRMSEYVLSPFRAEELPERDRMIAHAVMALEYLVRNGSARAMSAINSGALFAEAAQSATPPAQSSP